MERGAAEQVLDALRARTVEVVGRLGLVFCGGLVVAGVFMQESSRRFAVYVSICVIAYVALRIRKRHPRRAGMLLSLGMWCAFSGAMWLRTDYDFLAPVMALSMAITIAAFSWSQRGAIVIAGLSCFSLGAVLLNRHGLAELELYLVWLKASMTLVVHLLLLHLARRTLVGSIEQAQAQQQRFSAQLAESRTLESLGRLAGGVAHDFNNLLTVILGTADLLRATPGLDKDLAEDLEQIQSAGERAAELTTQLLAVGRRQVLRPEVLSPETALKAVLPLMQRLLPENIELALFFAPDVGNVRVDAPRLEQVIVNLIINARDALSAGGKITIETSNQVLDAAYAAAHVGVAAGQYVQIAVSDNGEGMADETLSRLFEPFYTTKMPGKGTGLGLATVHGIVLQSGGHIYVYSEPGKGACFKIYLPRVLEAVSLVPSSAPAAGAKVPPLRVLLVEDQADVRETVLQMLSASGHDVVDFADGVQALSAQPHAGERRFDVLITDVVMPNMDGPELAKRLAVLEPDLAVLYITGYTENAIVHGGVLDEGIHCLSKPFTQSALDTALARVIYTAGKAKRQ